MVAVCSVSHASFRFCGFLHGEWCFYPSDGFVRPFESLPSYHGLAAAATRVADFADSGNREYVLAADSNCCIATVLDIVSCLDCTWAHVGIKEMMADVVPFVCAAAFAIFIGWGSSRMVFIDLNCQGWWRLLPMAVKCCAAVCTYFIVMHFVHPDVYQESLDFIKRHLASKTGKFF